jgi:hypothetical protein
MRRLPHDLGHDLGQKRRHHIILRSLAVIPRVAENHHRCYKTTGGRKASVPAKENAPEQGIDN